MRSVLIAGCGYVGQAVAEIFHNAGWRVEGWTKSEPEIVRPYPIRAVDISAADQVRAAAKDFDAVIHCASTRGGDASLYRRVYFEGARNLSEAFAKSTILFTSSTSVYGQTDGERVTEESSANPKRETSQVLLEAEKVILDRGGIVARLGGIYGPGRSALLDNFSRGDVKVELDYFVNQIHRDDIASAFFLLLERQLPGGIYNVTDGSPILVNECYRWLEQRLNAPAVAKEVATSSRKRGNTSKRVDNAKLRGLGWTLRYPTFAEGMEKSVIPNHAWPAR